MKNKNSKKPVSPIYTIGVIWLLYSLLFHPVSTLGHLIGAGVLGLLGYGVVRLLLGRKGTDTQSDDAQAAAPSRAAAQEQGTARSRSGPTPIQPKDVQMPRSAAAQTVAKQKAEQKPKYPPEVQAVVDEGARAHRELARLYAAIPDLAVKRKVQQIIEISDKIVADAVEDPADVPQIKKFLDYYLPTTIKLLNSYERMGAQGIQGQNISGTMKNISEMLDTAIDAYKKLLDSLFANQALDVDTDIQVMNTLLKREGYINGGGSAFQTKEE